MEKVSHESIEALGAAGVECQGLNWCRTCCLSLFSIALLTSRASRGALVIKNLPAKEGDLRNTGSILGSGRSPGRRQDNGGEQGNTGRHPSILAWRIPWTEEISRGCHHCLIGLPS